MKIFCIFTAALFFAGASLADEQDATQQDLSGQSDSTTPAEANTKLSGAEKRRLQDEAVAALVEEHNEAVDDDLDEVVCEKRRVTGTRRTVRVCKTMREIVEEEAAADRALRMRNRASSDPAAAEGMGGN